MSERDAIAILSGVVCGTIIGYMFPFPAAPIVAMVVSCLVTLLVMVHG